MGQVSQSAQWAVSRLLVSFGSTLTLRSLLTTRISGSTLRRTLSSPIQLSAFSILIQVVHYSRPHPLSLLRVSSSLCTLSGPVSLSNSSDQNCYEVGGTGCFSVYGFEYKPGMYLSLASALFKH